MIRHSDSCELNIVADRIPDRALTTSQQQDGGRRRILVALPFGYRSTMRTFLFVTAAIVGCATVHPSPQQGASVARLTPRSTLLTPPSFADDAQRLRVMIPGATDSVERTMSEKTWVLHAIFKRPSK